MWRDQQSGQVVSRHDQVRALRPNVSFPAALTDAIIAAHGFDTIGEGNKPTVMEHQSAVRGDPVQSGGAWVFSWTVRDWSAEEIAAHEAAKIPQTVTRRQAKQALLLAGLLDNVQPAIDAMPDATQRRLMQLEWNEALEFERTRPSLIQLATAIGLDAAGIDALFVQAAGL